MWYQWQYSLMGSEILFVVGAVVITALIAVGVLKASGAGDERKRRPVKAERPQIARQDHIQLGRGRARSVRPHRPGWLHPSH